MKIKNKMNENHLVRLTDIRYRQHSVVCAKIAATKATGWESWAKETLANMTPTNELLISDFS